MMQSISSELIQALPEIAEYLQCGGANVNLYTTYKANRERAFPDCALSGGPRHTLNPWYSVALSCDVSVDNPFD